ncbi:RidA family protein [Leptotrichia sp. OH3620_COT-345]|uniref:Rid family detoxifying hydrolase n=1 Tax=Leptotrichia sp. OH3620_COT-345 TaxID=2491048 RepID=UPI000F651347|nr:Rid family detoxifying hydrolase [Leptotrichia sp. OH3620_COT-345]RRD38952.1 RidA family protein [Leptotrichia sp. OH3620_COT-345]
MKKIPEAVGPYSAFRIVGDFMYISGQLGINPETQNIDSDTVEGQAKQALENMKAILENNGFTMANVIKTTVLLDKISDFVPVNNIYAEYFEAPYPARSAFEVAKLPKGALVEIEAIAYIK